MNNKGFGEIQYIIFIGVFICLFTILGLMFHQQILEQKKTPEDSGLVDKIVDGFTSIIQWAGDNSLGKIPVVKYFWDIISNTMNLQYIQPYLGLLYLSLFGLPLGYIIIRLIRGGG